MSGSLKAALHRPVHQQIADHAEVLINLVDGTPGQIGYNQGIIRGLRLAIAVQDDVFKSGGHE